MLKRCENFKNMAQQIEGILAAVFTPCQKDGQLNLAIIPEYVQFLSKRGVQGILAGGSTGEAATFTLEERKLALKAWLDAARPLNMKVIAQVGGVPLPEVLDMARYAEQHKANAIMSLPELYYYFVPNTPEQLVSYLELVSNAAPSLPLLYYHVPSIVGIHGNIRKFFSLATSRIPNFKGMKARLDVAVQVADLMNEDQRIFQPNHMLAPSVLLGHESSTAAVTNIFPEMVCDLVKATRTGDVPLVRTLQGKLNKIVDGIASQGEFVPAMKVAMAMVTGIDVGPPRLPNAAINKEQRANIQKLLSDMDIKIHPQCD